LTNRPAECSYVWFSLKIPNETFESTVILADNLYTAVQHAHAEISHLSE